MGKEKKEIGKLLELLNEYEQLNMCRKFDSFELHTFENSSGVDRLLEDTVISARYGFVKWLVENDKIDINKTPGHYIYHYTDEDVIKEALMQLAIQDEPIEFLCSLLK